MAGTFIEAGRVYHSFTELGGVSAQASLDKPSELERFRRLSPLGKLRDAYCKYPSDSLRRVMRNMAMQEVMQLSVRERSDSGIRMVACVPPEALDPNGKLVSDIIMDYKVCFIFPFNRSQRCLATDRFSLSSVYIPPSESFSEDALKRVDASVAQGEFVLEKPDERYNRLCQEIKIVDSFIKAEKMFAQVETRRVRNALFTTHGTNRMDFLNHLKDEKIVECLVRAQDLVSQHPNLNPLYLLSLRTDMHHHTLNLWFVRSRPTLQGLIYPTDTTSVTRASTSVSTSINFTKISEACDRYLRGKDKVGDFQSYGLASILGLLPEDCLIAKG